MPIKDALLPLDLAVAFDDVVIAWDHPLAWCDKNCHGAATVPGYDVAPISPEMKDNF